jgi:hypothetical protein
MPYWDMTTSLALVFVALVTPLEVGFLDTASSALDPLFLTNRLVDVVFVVDLVLQFFLVTPHGSHTPRDPTPHPMGPHPLPSRPTAHTVPSRNPWRAQCPH